MIQNYATMPERRNEWTIVLRVARLRGRVGELLEEHGGGGVRDPECLKSLKTIRPQSGNEKEFVVARHYGNC